MGQGDGVGPELLVDAMAHAAELARKAVVRPVEGTILTVARRQPGGRRTGTGRAWWTWWSGRGRKRRRRWRARPSSSRSWPTPASSTPAAPASFCSSTPSCSSSTGARCPNLRASADAQAERAAPAAGTWSAAREPGAARRRRPALRGHVPPPMPDDSIEDFKEVWAGIGDSIVVVGGDGLWNCHIHTNDIGAAIEAALERGRPRRIRVTDLEEQVEEERWVRESAGAPGRGRASRAPGRLRPRPWWPSSRATASGASSARSACITSSSAARR